MTPEETRITQALIQAKDTIQELRHKLDLAIETLEVYENHVLCEVYPWMSEDATETLKKVRD